LKPLLIAALGLLIAWLFAGRQISLLLDRVGTVRVGSLPVSPIEYVGGSLSLGGRALSDTMPDNRRYEGRESFPRSVEPGDEIAFTVNHSWLSWPTPFETNFMTGHTTSWRRHRYYRLVWKKRSGAILAMKWRYEQWHYPAFGWTDGDMTREGSTGLLDVNIQPSGLEQVVVRYIRSQKGWDRSQYRIESRGSDVFAVIFLEDERGAYPGAGKSVQVHVDAASQRVDREFGGQ
jgi:hypothetical protein